MKIKTQINKLGRNSKDQKGFINPPIYKGSTIIFKNYKQYRKEKNIYEGLYGLNRTPNSDALESALKELYKCDSVVAVSSGLAAVSIPLVSILSKDQHIIVTDSLYSPTRKFIENQLLKYNIKVDYYSPLSSINDLKKLIKKNTKLIFIESPGTATFSAGTVYRGRRRGLPLHENVSRRLALRLAQRSFDHYQGGQPGNFDIPGLVVRGDPAR